METNNNTPNVNSGNNGKMVAGLIIIGIGCMLLVGHMGLLFIPHWLFSWPMWMIAIGIYIGAKCNFTKPNWIWMVGIGMVFLISWNVPLGAAFAWPGLLIVIGLYMITRHHYGPHNKQPDNKFTDYTEVK